MGTAGKWLLLTAGQEGVSGSVMAGRVSKWQSEQSSKQNE